MVRALRQVVETALVDKLHKNIVLLGFLQDRPNRAAVSRPGQENLAEGAASAQRFQHRPPPVQDVLVSFGFATVVAVAHQDTDRDRPATPRATREPSSYAPRRS